LVRHFIKKYNRQMNKSITSVHPQLLQFLMSREWKGEVRELENLVERLMIFADGPQLSMESLPPDSLNPMQFSSAKTGGSLKQAVEEFERAYILAELQRHGGRRKEAATALGIGEATLYRKISALNIECLDSDE